ncbi:DNA primase [Geoalkalibacter sp.]|uniref:DNA primase n=1 Tax=Geoalkalibacter sp. TaxID=3041440 RepID=UPI00272E8AA7|nr:DNA primase [Geoalkalibacter sp.]
MSGRISDDKIREVQERADILEVVSSYVALKRSGANHVGLCPFHAEKTPSFNVNPPRQIYHCFGCGVGGDAISFVQRMEGLSFPEAVRRLAERYGIDIAEEQRTPEEELARQRRAQLLRINEVAAAFYHGILMDPEDSRGRAARAYLRERGYGRETAERFQLGYAPEGWEALAAHLAGKGFESELVRRLGLTRPGKEGRGDYDLFRARLIFPIYSARGEVAAFGARVLDKSLPKYINSPESPVYHKSAVLYGLFQAREAMRRGGEAIVVEGYFDVLALHRAGFPQAVAACGTALTAEHARLLKRYAERVILLFDQDSAGRQATWRAMEALLPEGLPAAVATLEAGEDPDSFLARHGAQALGERLKAARPVFEVFLEETLATQGDSVEGRARGVEVVLAKLPLIPGEIERSLYRKLLAEKSGLDPGMLSPPPQPARRSAGAAGPGEYRIPPPEEPPDAGVALLGGPASPPRGRVAQRGRVSPAPQALIRYLLESGAARARARGEGLDNLLADALLRNLAGKILSLPDEGEQVSRGALSAALSAEEAALLTTLRLPARELFGEDLDGLFAECRADVLGQEARRRRRELVRRIEEAYAAGDSEAGARYSRELRELRRLPGERSD